jgi:dipeptidyl aminopeptidase/acylaminoacyl peptidase
MDVHPTWLTDDRFWYRTRTERGLEFFLVDPHARTRRPAFDQVKLAAALGAGQGSTVDPFALPFNRFDLSTNGDTVAVVVDSTRWRCDQRVYTCARGAVRGPTARPPEARSPDGKRAVFIRDFNLWVRDITTGDERQLTRDGIENFGYATDNGGWTHSDRPVVLWSPDSRKVATVQQDQRAVGDMYLVETTVGHPRLRTWKYPMAGDSAVITIQRVIIDVDSARVIRLRMPSDLNRSTVCNYAACPNGELADAQWSPDSRHLAFLSTSRDHKHVALRIADAATGAVRDVLAETAPTYYESGPDRDNWEFGVSGANWRYLPDSHAVIWFSERDNWGHLYLYDLETGALKNPITTGDGNVTQIVSVDEARRLIYFIAVGREAGRDPYYSHLYRVGFDGSHLTLLTPENANHQVSFAPSGRFFVDSYSRPDVPPVTILRNADGKQVMPLEQADISRLVAEGWKPPTPITVKARDGVTDLYGLMYRPSRFDSTRAYPIINHIYPGPQLGSVGSRAFRAARGDAQALAELGFIIVELDGMGTPFRSKRFHDTWYGNLADNTLPDQVAGMKELARRYRWIDLERAGIYGHSGGGFATADAMFRYPDFFKVGVSEAGNHDNRTYIDDWGEKYQGLQVRQRDGASNYDSQANQLVAKNLKGHLLLAHGLVDDNVPPSNTLLVEHELMQANKDFDLIVLTDRDHGFGGDPYMVRRRWDYFVRYLLGAEPPRYELHPHPVS